MGVVIGFSVRIDDESRTILREFATGLLNSLQTRVPWRSRKIVPHSVGLMGRMRLTHDYPNSPKTLPAKQPKKRLLKDMTELHHALDEAVIAGKVTGTDVGDICHQLSASQELPDDLAAS